MKIMNEDEKSAYLFKKGWVMDRQSQKKRIAEIWVNPKIGFGLYRLKDAYKIQKDIEFRGT